jgi:hypothetical protein
MKKQIAIALILMVALALAYPASAGKPTPQPYPAPGEEASAQMYPGPEPTPTPGVQLPSIPSDPTARGVVWGVFWNRIYATNDLGFPDFDAIVNVCLYRGYSQPVCYRLNPYYYDAALGRTWFESDPIGVCGPDWFIWFAAWDGGPMDIRQPADVIMQCIYLPNVWRNG